MRTSPERSTLPTVRTLSKVRTSPERSTLPKVRSCRRQALAKGKQEPKAEADRRTGRRGIRVLVIAALLVFLGAPSAVAVSQFRTTTAQSRHSRVIELATTLPAQIPVLLYHGIGTPSPVAGSVGNYNVTLTNFKADMAALAAAGYATVTPSQYVAWLHGINLRLPEKPVLITFDDAFWSDTFATPILAQYGFHAVMFVVTGYADGLYGTEYAPWKIVSALPGEGWYLQLHAGECGHALPTRCTGCMRDRIEHCTDQCLAVPVLHLELRSRQMRSSRHASRRTSGTGWPISRCHAGFAAGWRSQLFAAPFGAWSNGENPWLDSYWDSQFERDLHTADHSIDGGSSEAVPRPVPPGTRRRSPERALPHEQPGQSRLSRRPDATGTVGNAPTRGSG